VKDVPTTSRSLQGNAVCERMHQSVANVLCTALPLTPPQNLEQATQLIENALATTVYSTHAAVSRSLGVSPGNMVFNRDMFIDLPVLADLLTI
jgi:hypothetical protein